MNLVNAEIFPFARQVSVAGESDIYNNVRYSEGVLEVKGTATSFSVEIQACIDVTDTIEWTTLMVIDESNLTTLGSITEKGLYAFSMAGKNKIKVKINSVSGGYLTITGKFIG